MITGQCHCGATQFKIDAQIPKQLTRCTCSFCSKRGMLYAYYKPEQFTLTTPKVSQAEYRWNSKLVGIYFCPVCGCGTYNDSPAFEKDGSWDGENETSWNQCATLRPFRRGRSPICGNRREKSLVNSAQDD